MAASTVGSHTALVPGDTRWTFEGELQLSISLSRNVTKIAILKSLAYYDHTHFNVCVMHEN